MQISFQYPAPDQRVQKTYCLPLPLMIPIYACARLVPSMAWYTPLLALLSVFVIAVEVAGMRVQNLETNTIHRHALFLLGRLRQPLRPDSTGAVCRRAEVSH